MKPSLFKKISLALFCFVSVSAPSIAQNGDLPTDEASIGNGKTLFKNNCESCHSIGADVVVGPGLKGITERRKIEWLIPWIKNSQQVIQSGDEYAVALYNKYNKAVMTSFPSFSDKEIKDILAYAKAEGEKAVPVPVEGAQQAGGGQVTVQSDNSEVLNYVLLAFTVILLLILLVLVLIVSILTKFLAQKEGLDVRDKELVSQSFSLAPVVKSKAFKIAVTLIFVAVVGKAGLDGVMRTGIQQGYAPTQPIPFSHKIHAGQYNIECNYCHTGVRKGKSANIPSPNICLNCHQAGGVKPDSPKLARLRSAVETGRPIEWVRVHNLPDLAYFNHSQHVVVGNIKCQTCHGPIEEMEVVQQYSPLTMGWCINCHRETEVNSKGNAYYDKLVKLHESKSKKPMTVEDIGGLECSKCHY